MFDHTDPNSVLPALREVHKHLKDICWSERKKMSIDKLFKLHKIERRFQDMIVLLEHDLK